MVELYKLAKIVKNHEKRISKLEAKSKVQSASSSEHVKGRKSIMDLIIELKNGGFFKKPKFANEIVDKLAAMGHHYAPQSLTEPLQRAVRKRILGRVRKNGKWAYVKR